MKKNIAVFLFFLIPISGFSHWGDFIDTTIISRDSLIKIVNKGESQGSLYQGNILLKIYYQNKLALKLENPKETCLSDTSDKYIGIEHLNLLPLIAACEKIDSNHYVLLGYNLSDKRTGKFIWVLEVKNDKLIIKTRISMLSYRSPDQIDFFVNYKDSCLYFYNSSNKIIQDHVYYIGMACKDTYKLSAITEVNWTMHYSFPGIQNFKYAYVDSGNMVMRTYKVKFK